jgi:hypothetical protein
VETTVINDPNQIPSADLAGYRARHGEAGLAKLLNRAEIVRQGIEAREGGFGERIPELAKQLGVSLRSLYRLMSLYNRRGLAGLIRPERADKGAPRTLCRAAYQYVYNKYMAENRRTAAAVYDMLTTYAAAKGEKACESCIFNEDASEFCLNPQNSSARAALGDEAEYFPPCRDTLKSGMVVPGCPQTLSRVIASIPNDEKVLTREGKKSYQDKCQVMAQRQKPDRVNEVWFGDHHQLDCFILDDGGKPLRPWLTVWYDACSGCVVGWAEGNFRVNQAKIHSARFPTPRRYWTRL